MKNRLIGITLGLLFSSPLLAAGMNDDPTLYKVMLNSLEVQDNADGPNPVMWNVEGWVGRDLNKLWLKSEGSRVDGSTEEAEVQLLYSRAVAPYWDLQFGVRRDLKPGPHQDWLAVGFKGLAPYLFDINSTLFIGEGGQGALRLAAEYEMMFSQRWVLSPEVEANLYAKEDTMRGLGSGLADLGAGLRLRYEVRREFAPYIGIDWSRAYGGTADYLKSIGEDVQASHIVAGIRAWF